MNGLFSNEKVVFIVGGPGSGKSTQCPKIAKKYGFFHISAGDVLRAELKSGSEKSAIIQNKMQKGECVPSDIMTELLKQAMQDTGSKKILIDGFPRSMINLFAFETLLRIEPEFVVYFDCPEEVMKQRLLNRNQGRKDDNIDTIRRRIEGLKSIFPVIRYYGSKGKLRKIDAAKSLEEVSREIDSIFHFEAFVKSITGP